MKRTGSIIAWTLAAVVGLTVEVYITKWATETEKDPDLAETVLFQPEDYPRIAARIAPDGLQSHIDALTHVPSRLTGTAGCDQAAEYIAGQFRALGAGEPVVEEFPVVVPISTVAEVRTARGAFPLHPVYPNGICPAAMPAEGLATRLVYAGTGSLADVEGKDLFGATVVVETGAREQWLYLIDLGAHAIIFAERERPPRYMAYTTQTLSHQNVPRFWMTAAEAAPLLALLKQGDLDARLFSDARWEQRNGKNLWIDLPGASVAEHNQDECIVLQAYYDSSSFVPDLAPGAEQACGIAALLELGKIVRDYPFQKRVRLLATSGHFQAMEGIRRYVWEHVGRHSSPMRDVSPQGHGALFSLDLSSGGPRVGLFYTGHYFQQLANNLKPRMTDLGRRASEYAEEIGLALGRPPEWMLVDTINPVLGKDWVTYAPTGLALEHEAALLAGIPALGFVTVNDTRFYAATPDDTSVNLDNLVLQTQLLACLLPNAFNVEGRYLKRSLPRTMCEITGRVVSFDPREGYLPAKPAPGALVMARNQLDSMWLTGVASRPMAVADEGGQFHMVGLATADEVSTFMATLAFEAFVVEDGRITWAPDFGQLGRESYPIELLPVQKQMELMCVVFPCKTLDIYNLVDPRSFHLLNRLEVFEAENNSHPPVYGATLVESAFPWTSFFAPTASIFTPPGKRLKVTAGVGATQKRLLLLNAADAPPEGELFNTGLGFDVDVQSAIHHTYLQGARDLWRLDESRIQFFRSHGIENARVNTLHDQAGAAIATAESALAQKQYQEYFIQARRGLSLESRAYPDVVGMANDVVRGLVFYLVLLLPFAFTMERLFLAGRRVETRILGILAMFLGMFAILRLTHPAFQIVLSPMVVLLGFSVATLSTVIISIVMSKLDALVSRRRVEQLGQHESGVQAVSGFALALELGIANMRRRRARTILTSVTLIVLTFSVLSFVSVTSQLRTQRYAYAGGATPYPGVLLRTRNWAPFPFETYAALRNEYGAAATLAPRRWYYGALILNQSYIDIQKGDVIRAVNALVGLSAQEQEFLDVQSALLGKSRWLSPDTPGRESREEALLPINLVLEFMGRARDAATLTEAEKVRLADAFLGEKIAMLGRQFEVVGVYDWEKMNALVDIDGERLTPFDPVEMEKLFQEEGTPDPESVQRYIHHSFRDVVITGEHVLGNLGGDLRSVAIRPHNPEDLEPMLEGLVRRLDYILFADLDGVPTLLSSRNTTRISEIWNLLVLLAIAGLIVFNTMLGSVFERTKEIGTYTALGIAPSHIGRLFLVEAAVFAILGVMAGYVFGQTVSRVVHMVDLPALSALDLNYSSLAGVGACVLVMGMVILSSAYPARKASELGVPDIERRWKLPPTKETTVTLELPFTVSIPEAPGLVAFLKEYLDAHVDVSVGDFYVENVEAGPHLAEGRGTGACARFWLTPFDLGVSQYVTFDLGILEDMNVCGVRVRIERLSGDAGSWRRANGHFMTTMRSQFLIWRNLTPQARADYCARGKEYAFS